MRVTIYKSIEKLMKLRSGLRWKLYTKYSHHKVSRRSKRQLRKNLESLFPHEFISYGTFPRGRLILELNFDHFIVEVYSLWGSVPWLSTIQLSRLKEIAAFLDAKQICYVCGYIEQYSCRDLRQFYLRVWWNPFSQRPKQLFWLKHNNQFKCGCDDAGKREIPPLPE